MARKVFNVAKNVAKKAWGWAKKLKFWDAQLKAQQILAQKQADAYRAERGEPSLAEVNADAVAE